MFEFSYKPELYPVFSLLGIISGGIIYSKFKPKSYFEGEMGRLYTAFIAISAVSGAYLSTPINYLVNNPSPELLISKSLVIGFFFAFLASDIAKYFIGAKGPTGEVFALSLPLTLAISRFGCIFAHCCHGLPSESYFALINNGIPSYPAPVYEIFFHLTAFCVILYSFRKGIFEGYRLRSYLIAYAVFRFITEYYRGYPKIIFDLSLYQVFAVLLLLVVLRALIFDPPLKDKRVRI